MAELYFLVGDLMFLHMMICFESILAFSRVNEAPCDGVTYNECLGELNIL